MSLSAAITASPAASLELRRPLKATLLLVLFLFLSPGLAQSETQSRTVCPEATQAAGPVTAAPMQQATLPAHVAEQLVASLTALEQESGRSIGLAAYDVQTKTAFFHHGSTRYAFCSTFKFFVAAEILRLSQQQPDLLTKRLHWERAAELEWAPGTRGRGKEGMTVAELCTVAVQQSDNTAANLLLTELGGPDALNAAMRRMGDTDFVIRDDEPEVNRAGWETGAADKNANTTTARGYLAALHTVLFGDMLAPGARARLLDFAGAVQTGSRRIAAALPDTARLWHKTGSAYGNVHDLGLVRLGEGERARDILLVIFVKGERGQLEATEDVLSRAAGFVLDAFGVQAGPVNS